MSNFKEVLRIFLHSIENTFDHSRVAFKRALRIIDPIMIQPYRGFATQEKIFLNGRVLEREGMRKPSETDSAWKNFRAMFKRIGSDEIPYAKIKAEFHQSAVELKTNDDGYFDLQMPHNAPLEEGDIWHKIKFTLLEKIRHDQGEVTATGEFIAPDTSGDFIIVSDIDDTIIETHSTDLSKMIRLTLLQNAHTRVPFEGVGEFYKSLQRGPEGISHNPIFYVSNSPWNIYDLLVDFMDIHDIPAGPLLLRDFGLDKNRFLTGSKNKHKMIYIARLMELYPDKKFIFIGDSGEKDPEIYFDLVTDFPRRVTAVFIRDVTNPRRDRQIRKIAEQARSLETGYYLVKDSEEAARYAIEAGLITEESLEAISSQKEEDKEGATV